MGLSQLRALFAALVIVSAAIHGARGDAMLTGTVFCDQCKDGLVSLFDYPLHGIKVAMGCPGSNGKFSMWREETTNWLGNFVMRFEGTPNLSGCYARVIGNRQRGSNGCGAVAGPAKRLRLTFSMFDMETYAVEPLVAQPADPMDHCPGSSSRHASSVHVPFTPPPNTSSPTPAVVPVTPTPPVVPVTPTPAVPVNPTPPVVPVSPPGGGSATHTPAPVVPVAHPPVRRSALPPRPPPLPPLPQLPPVPRGSILETSACTSKTWNMPQYRCRWRVVSPDTRVAIAFGLVAAQRFGTEMSLAQALRGRGEPYRTLLREGTTALLNSYNSIRFPYNPVTVIQQMNWALAGSARQALHTGLGFMRANSGAGTNVTCNLSPCN